MAGADHDAGDRHLALQGRLVRAALGDGLVHHLAVQVITDRGDVAALRLAEEVARAIGGLAVGVDVGGLVNVWVTVAVAVGDGVGVGS